MRILIKKKNTLIITYYILCTRLGTLCSTNRIIFFIWYLMKKINIVRLENN